MTGLMEIVFADVCDLLAKAADLVLSELIALGLLLRAFLESPRSSALPTLFALLEPQKLFLQTFSMMSVIDGMVSTVPRRGKTSDPDVDAETLAFGAKRRFWLLDLKIDSGIPFAVFEGDANGAYFGVERNVSRT